MKGHAMGVDSGRAGSVVPSRGDLGPDSRAGAAAEGRSAVGLSPQYRARLQRVKDAMRENLGRDVTHIEALEYLLRYWEEWGRDDER